MPTREDKFLSISKINDFFLSPTIICPFVNPKDVLELVKLETFSIEAP